MDGRETILSFLKQNALPFRLLSHEPVRGMDDCISLTAPLNAVYPKNLFLSPRGGGRRCLLLLSPEKRFSAPQVSRQAGSSRLQLGGTEELYALLGARPGAVSALALCLPTAKDVSLLVDGDLLAAPSLCFHPLDPAETVVLEGEMFFKRFLPLCGKVPQLLSL